MSLTAAEVFRDYVTDGVPGSGVWNPKKSEIRALLSSIERIVNIDVNAASPSVFADKFGASPEQTASYNAGAIADAANEALAIGGTLMFGPGRYQTSGQLIFDYSASESAEADLNRVSIVGAGPFATSLNYTGAGAFITYLGGGGTTGNQVGVSIRDMMILGTNAAGSTGLDFRISPWLSLERIYVTGWDLGMLFEDVDFCGWDGVLARFNRRGFIARQKTVPGTFSTCPNGWSIRRSSISSNSIFGGWVFNGASFTIEGGTDIQNNGYSTNPADDGELRWGIRATDLAYQGGTGLNLGAAYVEANAGEADIWIEQTGALTPSINGAVHNIIGNSFNRTSLGTDPAQYHILAQFHPNAGPQRLNLIGNGFKKNGTYTPGGGRKDVYFDPAFQSANYFNFYAKGNVHEDAGEGNIETTWIGSIEEAASVASASTVDLGATAASRVTITGTTTITSFGTGAFQLRLVEFSGALTLTHNAASLILPFGENIITKPGDKFLFASDGSGNWKCWNYQDVGGAWTSYSPTPTPEAGSFTAAACSGAYTKRGKAVTWRGKLTITDIGTGMGYVQIPLPASTTLAHDLTAAAIEWNNGGDVKAIYGSSGNGFVRIYTPPGFSGSHASGDEIPFVITYEAA